MRPVRLNAEIIDAVLRLRAAQLRWDVVSEKIGISEETLKKRLREAGYRLPNLPKARTPWPEEAVHRLREAWASGDSAAAIGRRIGYSKGAVIGKAHRLGLPARPSPIGPGALARSRTNVLVCSR